MGSDIIQHRVRIGLFNSFKFRPIKYKNRKQRSEPTYKYSSSNIIYMIVLIISLCIGIATYNDFKLSKPAFIVPGQLVQSSTSDNSSLVPHLISTSASSSYRMITNFQSRYLHGNRKNQGMKICHWNKGGSHLQNKMPELRNIVSGIHPHIFGVSEANLHHHHDQDLVQLNDYDLHLPHTLSNPSLKVSRIVTYTHKSIIAKARADLMSDTISSIWLEVGLPRCKRFLICQKT